MNSASPGKITIHGTVAKGFESVRQLFERQTNTLIEDKVQLCVYHRGEKVIDLWASASEDPQFSADSMVNVFSSGKSLEAIAVAWLVDKGLLQYSDKIVQHWPEFGEQGKDGLTVADLMRHEAGLANFDTSLDMKDLFRESIKENVVGSLIEAHSLSFPAEDTRREYHALTRGWIVNELFRRVDPAGRTIGEFLRDDISGPLQADVVVGVSEEDRARMSPLQVLGIGRHLLLSMVPKFLGRRVVHNVFQLLGRLIKIVPGMLKGGKNRPPPPFTGMKDLSVFNEPDFSRGETPSANATCSAAGLARVAAMMAGRGTLDGQTFLSPGAWQALHEHPLEAPLGGMLTTRFTQGGVDTFTAPTPASTQAERDFNEGREGFYGWMGLGGSIFQWHPELDIGFAFVPTSLHVLDFLNERGKAYQAEVLACVGRLPADG